MNVRALSSPPVSLWCYFEEVEWEEICRWCQWGLISGACSPAHSQWTVVTLTQTTTPTASVRVNIHKGAFCFTAQPKQVVLQRLTPEGDSEFLCCEKSCSVKGLAIQ